MTSLQESYLSLSPSCWYYGKVNICLKQSQVFMEKPLNLVFAKFDYFQEMPLHFVWFVKPVVIPGF